MIKSLCMFSPGVQCSCSGLSSLHPALCVCVGGGAPPGMRTIRKIVDLFWILRMEKVSES